MQETKLFPEIDSVFRLSQPPPEGHPYLVSVNMYAIGKGPITLIDGGMRSPGSFSHIEKQLTARGFCWSDVERIILTHCHGDHVGMVTEIIDAAGHGVDCFIHPEDKWRIAKEECGGRVWDWDEDVEEFFFWADMPAEEIVLLRKHFEYLEGMAEPIGNLLTMEEGKVFKGNGFRLQVVHTPGHSPGACCLYEPDQRILFSGDSVIDHIPPNAIMELKGHRLRDSQYQSLGAHLNSLEKLLEMDVRYVFSGHGQHSDKLSHCISTYVHHHQQMMNSIIETLGSARLSIYQLARKMFRHKSGANAYFAVSEITVHLQQLITDGRVERLDGGPPALFQAC